MNCATHNDVEAVAYCRTCGKALCQKCVRSVRGVIYCENCLAARLEGVQPQVGAPIAGFVPSAPANHAAPGSEPGSGPNPTVAGILGAIPFGVGAIYCGQYAKGLAHMLIFIGLVWGASSDPNGMGWLFGMGIPFL
ncbi:MAG TPA: B-box zinc finger protein, partial [Terriglobales bacterium]|nr:B-box zinc finger protein [Terriglobales bacterium]